MKFGTLAAAVAVSIAVGLPAGAQDKAMEKAPGNDPVVAIVNNDKIFRSDLDTARGQLPDQYRNLPMDQLFTPLVNQLVRSKLMAGKARSEKLHVSEGYLKRLALVRERLLEEALLDKIITARVTDKAMRAKYEKSVADFPSKEEVRARHILVKTEGEAKALVKQLDVVAWIQAQVSSYDRYLTMRQQLAAHSWDFTWDASALQLQEILG